jgi:predicted esterase
MKPTLSYTLIILAFLAGVCTVYLLTKKAPDVPIKPSLTPSLSITDSPTPMPTPSVTILTKKPVSGFTHFFEEQPVINGQQTYIAYPLEIPTDNPPLAIVYYHGSGQSITKDFSQEVMQNMRAYGAYFTERNLVFIASQQHGDNYGKAVAIEDTVQALDYVRKTYSIQKYYAVMGFSMGGMPALRHAIMYPNLLKKIVLLAPVNGIETYSVAEKKTLASIDTKLWHGTKDTNVPYWATELLVKGLKPYNPKLEVVTLQGKIHWDVDTEYMEDIAEFVKN